MLEAHLECRSGNTVVSTPNPPAPVLPPSACDVNALQARTSVPGSARSRATPW